jgi:hypothetical protein
MENTLKPIPSQLFRLGLGLLIAGLVLVGLNFIIDDTEHHKRFWLFYNAMFFVLTSLGLGALFIIALEYVANAYWSVPTRRISEANAWLLPIAGIIGLPLLFNMGSLFEWVHPHGNHLLEVKSVYLNEKLQIIRYVAYFAIWTFSVWFVTRTSQKQDQTHDAKLTTRNIRYTAPYMILFAITLTFFSIDWLMSHHESWFSTMFGVTQFAGLLAASLAIYALLSIYLSEKGAITSKWNDNYLYPVSNLMMGSSILWGGTSMVQYMLQNYAGMPEETSFYVLRWENGWWVVSLLLVFVNFLVPFYGLASRPAKTNRGRVQFIAWWLIGAHILEAYWLLLPNLTLPTKDPINTPVKAVNPYFNFTDIGFVLLTAGIVLVVFVWQARKIKMLPEGDPKLGFALKWHP